MASKSTNESEMANLDPDVHGQQVWYYGFKGATSTCARCGKKTNTGMIRLLGGVHYCSAACVTSDK